MMTVEDIEQQYKLKRSEAAHTYGAAVASLMPGVYSLQEMLTHRESRPHRNALAMLKYVWVHHTNYSSHELYEAFPDVDWDAIKLESGPNRSWIQDKYKKIKDRIPEPTID